MSEALIARLAADAHPVPRLHPAWLRAGFVLLLAAILIAALTAWHGPRADLAAWWDRPGFALRLLGSLATSVLGMLAAAELAIPGRPRLWIMAPLAGLALWLTGIGGSCLSAWVVLAPDGIQPDEVARCLGTVALTGTAVALAMAILLRRAAPLRPLPCTLAAGLAAAGTAGFALTLLHPVDASVMVLAWNFGLTFLLIALELATCRWLRPVSAPGPIV